MIYDLNVFLIWVYKNLFKFFFIYPSEKSIKEWVWCGSFHFYLMEKLEKH